MHKIYKKVTLSLRTIANTFKKHFANLASYLVKKLPDPTGKFEIPSVRQYYKETNFRGKKLKSEKISSVQFKTNKTSGVDNLAGRYTLYTYG